MKDYIISIAQCLEYNFASIPNTNLYLVIRKTFTTVYCHATLGREVEAPCLCKAEVSGLNFGKMLRLRSILFWQNKMFAYHYSKHEQKF